MTLESVEERVREDVDAQIEESRTQSALKIQAIEAETRAAITAQMQRSVAETERFLERMQTREKLSTQLIVKKILLGARREALHDTFIAAMTALREDPERYPRFLRSQLAQAAMSIDISAILVEPAEIPLVEAILGGQDDVSAGIMPDMHVHGGFVAESEGARVRYDASAKTIFEELAHLHLKDVADILWPREAASTSNPDGRLPPLSPTSSSESSDPSIPQSASEPPEAT